MYSFILDVPVSLTLLVIPGRTPSMTFARSIYVICRYTDIMPNDITPNDLTPNDITLNDT